MPLFRRHAVVAYYDITILMLYLMMTPVIITPRRRFDAIDDADDCLHTLTPRHARLILIS